MFGIDLPIIIAIGVAIIILGSFGGVKYKKKVAQEKEKVERIVDMMETRYYLLIDINRELKSATQKEKAKIRKRARELGIEDEDP